VKRVGVLCAALWLAVGIAGCTPNKQQGTEDYTGQQARFDPYGINLKSDNLGRDKGPAAMIYQKNIHRREPHLLALLERHAERIPGVQDIKVLAFKDNLLIGVLTADTPKPDQVNPNPTIPHEPGSPNRIDNGHTDHIQMKVVKAMRSRLQAETRFNIMYVSTNKAIYQRIADLHERILRGETVRDEEFQTLLNDIGYTSIGFELVH
jgi:hypothetical protein